MAAFQACCRAHLRQAIPPANTRPIRVFRQDDSRFGLVTIRRRRLTARGVQPTTGDRFFLALPSLPAETCQIFVDLFAQALSDSPNLLRLDNSGAHTAQQLTIPENVCLVLLPPYGPELKPMERVWRDLKDALAWLQCPTLDEDSVAILLRGSEAITRQALAGYLTSSRLFMHSVYSEVILRERCAVCLSGKYLKIARRVRESPPNNPRRYHVGAIGSAFQKDRATLRSSVASDPILHGAVRRGLKSTKAALRRPLIRCTRMYVVRHSAQKKEGKTPRDRRGPASRREELRGRRAYQALLSPSVLKSTANFLWTARA
jgi:transposase